MVLFVKRVGVVGGGAMGSQIADIMAINGKEVIIKDISEEYLKYETLLLTDFVNKI